MKIVALDIDGCLANFTSSYARALIKVGGDRLPKGWETDPEWPKEWYWDRAAGYPPEVEKEVWSNYILQPGSKFWEQLDALPGTDESLMVLNGKVKRGEVDCYFLTHRIGHRAKNQTETWLYNHGIDYPTVLLAADKVPYLTQLKPDFFIDDKPDHVLAALKADVVDQLYLRITPYNKDLWEAQGFKKAVSVKDALVDAGLWE